MAKSLRQKRYLLLHHHRKSHAIVIATENNVVAEIVGDVAEMAVSAAMIALVTPALLATSNNRIVGQTSSNSKDRSRARMLVSRNKDVRPAPNSRGMTKLETISLEMISPSLGRNVHRKLRVSSRWRVTSKLAVMLLQMRHRAVRPESARGTIVNGNDLTRNNAQ